MADIIFSLFLIHLLEHFFGVFVGEGIVVVGGEGVVLVLLWLICLLFFVFVGVSVVKIGFIVGFMDLGYILFGFYFLVQFVYRGFLVRVCYTFYGSLRVLYA